MTEPAAYGGINGFNDADFLKGTEGVLLIGPWASNKGATTMTPVGYFEASPEDDRKISYIEPPNVHFPVDYVRGARSFKLTGNFWQADLDLLRLANGDPVSSLLTTVPRAAGTTDGYSKYLIDNDDDQDELYRVELIILRQRMNRTSGGDTFKERHCKLWKCISEPKTKLAMKKDGAAVTPFTLVALRDGTISNPAVNGYVGYWADVAPK